MATIQIPNTGVVTRKGRSRSPSNFETNSTSMKVTRWSLFVMVRESSGGEQEAWLTERPECLRSINLSVL